MNALLLSLAPLGEDFAQPSTSSYFGIAMLALGLALAFGLAMLIPYAARRAPVGSTLHRLSARRGSDDRGVTRGSITNPTVGTHPPRL